MEPGLCQEEPRKRKEEDHQTERQRGLSKDSQSISPIPFVIQLPNFGFREQTEGEAGGGGRRRREGVRDSHSPVQPQLPPFPGTLSGSPDHAGEKTLHPVLPQPPVIPQKSGFARTRLRWNAFSHVRAHTSTHAGAGAAATFCREPAIPVPPQTRAPDIDLGRGEERSGSAACAGGLEHRAART